MADPILHQVLSLLRDIKTEQATLATELGKRDVALIVGFEKIASMQPQRDAGGSTLKDDIERMAAAQQDMLAQQAQRDAAIAAIDEALQGLAARAEADGNAREEQLRAILTEKLAVLSEDDGSDAATEQLAAAMVELGQRQGVLGDAITSMTEAQTQSAEAMDKHVAVLMEEIERCGAIAGEAAGAVDTEEIVSSVEPMLEAKLDAVINAVLTRQTEHEKRLDSVMRSLVEAMAQRDALLREMAQRQQAQEAGQAEAMAQISDGIHRFAENQQKMAAVMQKQGEATASMRDAMLQLPLDSQLGDLAQRQLTQEVEHAQTYERLKETIANTSEVLRRLAEHQQNMAGAIRQQSDVTTSLRDTIGGYVADELAVRDELAKLSGAVERMTQVLVRVDRSNADAALFGSGMRPGPLPSAPASSSEGGRRTW